MVDWQSGGGFGAEIGVHGWPVIFYQVAGKVHSRIKNHVRVGLKQEHAGYRFKKGVSNNFLTDEQVPAGARLRPQKTSGSVLFSNTKNAVEK
jgi:hypothetical protein